MSSSIRSSSSPTLHHALNANNTNTDSHAQQRLQNDLDAVAVRLKQSLMAKKADAKKTEELRSELQKDEAKTLVMTIIACACFVWLIGVFMPQHHPLLLMMICTVPCMLTIAHWRIVLHHPNQRKKLEDASVSLSTAIESLTDSLDRVMLARTQLSMEGLDGDDDEMRECPECDLHKWEIARAKLQAEDISKIVAMERICQRPPRRENLIRRTINKAKVSVPSNRQQQQQPKHPNENVTPNIVQQLKQPIDDGGGTPPKGASKVFLEYVATHLPLERLDVETEEEVQFSQLVDQETNGKFSQLPHDLKLMALRAWRTHPHRLKHTSEQVGYIIAWRTKVKADSMLNTLDRSSERFFYSWCSRTAGYDQYGHPIVYDRLQDFDLPYLFSLDDETILKYHTLQMEVLRRIKAETSRNRGHRVSQHIYMLDLKGFSLTRHFTTRLRNLLDPIFKLEGTAYPESLFSLWLLNVPAMFRGIWALIAPAIDPSTQAKIHLLGSFAKSIPIMAQSGIPLSSVPKDFGGECESTNYHVWYKKFVHEAAGGGDGDGVSTIRNVQ